MGSWFHCPCGNAVHKNAFTGCGVRLVVEDAVIDQIPDSATADQALRHILSSHDILVRCSQCGRIAMEDRSGGLTTYRPDR